MAQRKTTTRKTRTKKDEIPEVCDHSMENAERLKCLSGRVDAIGSKLSVIKENDLSHIQDDISHLKEESKETKDKLHEVCEEQAGIKSDVKNLVKSSDKNERALSKIQWYLIGGGGSVAALVAFKDVIAEAIKATVGG